MSAEQDVIGAVLLDPKAYYRAGPLAPEDFEDRRHQLLWQIIEKQIKATGDASLPLLAGEMSDIGLVAYLHELGYNAASAKNVVAHAEAVRRASTRRKAIAALAEGLERLESKEDVQEVLGDVFSNLNRLGSHSSKSKSFRQCAEQALEEVKSAGEAAAAGKSLGVSTTVPYLNNFLGGLHGGRLYVLGGRPGRFKSVFASQICWQAARSGMPTGIISLEMSGAELATRAFAAEYDLDLGLLNCGDPEVSRDLQKRLDPRMFDWPVQIDDSSKTLAEVVARVHEWHHRHEVKLVVVDHLQLMKTGRNSRFEELSEISRTLKTTALELNTPILALSQLSREVERERRAPQLSDLRECGNIEQDADCVMFLHSKDADEHVHDKYVLILAKNRGGPSRKMVDLRADGRYARISEVIPY